MVRRVTRTDIVFVCTIVALGALQVFLVRRGDAFVSGDTTYIELAESIVHGEPYGFNGTPGTLIPPGMPSFLALLCVSTGCGHANDLRVLALFSTLGFLISYALIRRIGGRGIAGAACLLPMASPEIFSFSTNLVFSDLPYFAGVSLAFWLALDADSEVSSRRRVATSLLFATTLAMCLMLRTAAVAIVAGAIAWVCASALVERGAARRRLRWLAPALLVGVVIQGIWMVWTGFHEVSEWPLGGYPKSYLSQLMVVNGNRPELGNAGGADWVRRVDDNLLNYTTTGEQLLTHHSILPDGASPAISGVLGLLLVGLVACFLERGGRLHDFAFVASAAMVVAWPWDVEIRFLLPLLPLACWYVWRGMLEIGRQARLHPRRLGTALIAVSVPLAALAGRSAVRLGTIQPIASTCFWIAGAAAALWVRERGNRLRVDLGLGPLAPRLARAALTVGIAGLVVVGVVGELAIGRGNLAFDVAKSPNYPEIQAAQWLQEHVDEGAVLMARDVSIVHHMSHRKVVWLPPLGDTGILMAGIRHHGVQWVVVTEKIRSYWLPQESDVFQGLLAAHPEAFQLEAVGPRWRVFRVTSGASTPGNDDVAAGPPGSSP